MQSTIATGQALQLDIIANSTDWEGQFDAIEVWRSRLSSGGPYDALTGGSWAPATIPSDVTSDPPNPSQTGPSVIISGKSLILLVEEKFTVTINFGGSDPLTFQTAAAAIQNNSSGLLTAFVLDNLLVIRTVKTGTGASLRIVGGDAAPLLGLSTKEPDSLAFGQDARIPLIHGVSSYLFTDLNGDKTFFYKTRFVNTLTDVTSEFSLPFQGSSITSVSPANLVRAFVDLVDLNGNPSSGVPVLIYNRFNGTQVEGKVAVGGPQNLLTDGNGHTELLLVRGSSVTVAIGGTDLVRDISVPTDSAVTSFNLLDPAYGSNDLFNVQVPNLDYAVRRTL